MHRVKRRLEGSAPNRPGTEGIAARPAIQTPCSRPADCEVSRRSPVRSCQAGNSAKLKRVATVWKRRVFTDARRTGSARSSASQSGPGTAAFRRVEVRWRKAADGRGSPFAGPKSHRDRIANLTAGLMQLRLIEKPPPCRSVQFSSAADGGGRPYPMPRQTSPAAVVSPILFPAAEQDK
jgi:hypothetical protein